MKAMSRSAVALAVAAALGGCAGGGGSKPPPVEDTIWCVLVLPCLFAQPTSGASTGPAATNKFASWDNLAREGVTHTSGGIVAASSYIVQPDGTLSVRDGVLTGDALGQVQYSASGEAVQFSLAGGVAGGSKPGSPISSLATAGVPWLDYALRDQPLQGVAPKIDPQTPFSDRPAHGLEVVANPYKLGWNYQSFGVWDTLGMDERALGATSFGSATPASAVPASGSATFTGKLAGLYTPASGQAALAAANVSLQANFSARSLSFSSSGTTLVGNLATATAAPALDLSGTLTYAAGSGRFSGTLTNAGGTMQGSSLGQFYGPAAQEAGGAFSLKSASGAERFTGAYGAKR